ncbi:hypothetical protein HPB50_029483 [Hyalomma asiaticum]|nr:hypothetical protein HPB50_029483 [Hyalomma asiaticum]
MKTASSSRTLLAANRVPLARCWRRLAGCLRYRLLVAAGVMALASAVEGSCPSREFIYPCTCTETFIGNYVMCTVVREEQLRLPFQYLRDYNLSRLFLSNVTFSLNPDVFTGLKGHLNQDSDHPYPDSRSSCNTGHGTNPIKSRSF